MKSIFMQKLFQEELQNLKIKLKKKIIILEMIKIK